MATVRIKVPEPHSDPQRQIMEAFLTPGVREVWVACGTKFGKTLSAAGAFTAAVPLKRQKLWRWIGPIYKQSEIGYNYMRRMLPPQIIHPRSSDLTIDFPAIDSRIQFFHGQRPEDIEGEATAGNVIDEASKQKAQVYASVKTTTTQTGGVVMPISTPRGRGNWFHKGCLKAQEEMRAAKREGRRPRYLYIHAPTYANPFVPAESIEEMRRSLPARLFKQYVEAEFLDDGSVFLMLSEAFGIHAAYEDIEEWFLPGHLCRRVFVGADWGKQEDKSVFTAIGDDGRLVGFKRFNKMPYPEQVGELFKFCRALQSKSGLEDPMNQCHIIAEHDQTGVGEAINDIIVATNPGIDIVGIVWTNKLKEIYVNDLMSSFEQKEVRLHPIQILRDELDAFEVATTATGKYTYAAPEGMTDDCVMSLVIANRLYRENRGVISTVGVVDYLESVVRKIYYNGGVVED